MITGLINDTFEIQNEHHAKLVSEYIPITAEGSPSSCHIYERSSNKIDNSTTIVPCDRWVYDRSVFIDTVITEVG